MLSILIPTYNYNVFPLVQTLRKNLNFLDVPVEIIVGDDASPVLIEAHRHLTALQDTTFIKLEKNIGRTALRTHLAERAKFPWLLFLDADVMPVQKDFLDRYLAFIKQGKYDLISGGITYEKEKPSVAYSLRWSYGRAREAKPAEVRNKTPYAVNSPNFCVRKSLFLEVNTFAKPMYGLDHFFSYQLAKRKSKVLHVDNPVYHLGLEPNAVFLKKALEAVKTTVDLEGQKIIFDRARPLQKSYHLLKKWRLLKLFTFIIGLFQKEMEANFLSKKPNLFWFDLYRLDYYIRLKRNYES